MYSECDLCFRPGLVRRDIFLEIFPKFRRRKNFKSKLSNHSSIKVYFGSTTCISQDCFFLSSELSENPKENVPFAAWSFQRLQFYQIYGTIFLIYLYQNDHTRKENKIQSIYEKMNPPLTLYINIKSFLWEFFMALQGNKHGIIIEQMSKLPDLKTINPFGSDSIITKNVNWKM